MGLLNRIKDDAKRMGNSKGKLFYVKEGQKARVRFLKDMDDGSEFVFHDSFTAGINVICQEHNGKSCEYCDMDEDSDVKIRTRSQYAWPVWDYEAKKVKLFIFAVNNCSPIPALMAMYENYGTLTDRDYVISVSGKQKDKTYSVVPMDKNKFKNTKAKPFSERKILEILNEAFPYESDDDDEEEDKRPAKSKSKKGKKKSKPAPEPEEDDDDFDDDYDDEDFEDEDEDEDEDDEIDYSEMSAKELYKLCKERDIDVKPKKSSKLYIKKLEEYDESQGEDEDWEDDEWEDDDE